MVLQLPAERICQVFQTMSFWYGVALIFFWQGLLLVKAAVGEDCTEDELGGAQMHAQTTGLGEYLCEDDAHAIAMARR